MTALVEAHLILPISGAHMCAHFGPFWLELQEYLIGAARWLQRSATRARALRTTGQLYLAAYWSGIWLPGALSALNRAYTDWQASLAATTTTTTDGEALAVSGAEQRRSLQYYCTGWLLRQASGLNNLTWACKIEKTFMS